MDAGDDLTAITGIGEARARQLREELGIASLDDLAALTPDELEARLRAGGVAGVSRGALESWIAQARERVPAPQAAEAEVPARPAASRPRPSNGDGRWRAEASFVVELQSDGKPGRWRTAVHHMEGDTGEEWAGFDCEPLCAWLTERLPPGLTEPPGAEAPPAPPPPQRGPGPLSVTLEADAVDGEVDQPVRQIPLGSAWAVDVRWALAEPPPEAAGEWSLRVSFEPLGPGEPLAIMDRATFVAAPAGETAYRHRIDVPPGVATPAHLGPTYCGVVVLTFEPEGTRVAPGAWFCDLRPIRFHDGPDG